MKLAVITDSSAVLPGQLSAQIPVTVLDIPIIINGETYIEGQNLTIEEFFQKMAASPDLPKTSQPSLAALDTELIRLREQGFTHVIGLFLSSGISGFWQNIQYLKDEHDDLMIAFPDSKITSAPLGLMVANIIKWAEDGQSFEEIMAKLDQQIAETSAFIMVDDLNHLVKGGRLSNGSAILGNLLSIKPILYFNDEGKIVVYDKVRTEKKAIKRLKDILTEKTANGDYEIAIIHSNVLDKAQAFQDLLSESYPADKLSIVDFSGVIATHLGEGAIAFGISPVIA